MGALAVWSINVRKSAQQPKAGWVPIEPSMEKVVQFSDKKRLFPETSVEPPPLSNWKAWKWFWRRVESADTTSANHGRTASQPDLQEAALTERHVASVTDSKPAIDIEDMLETLDGDAESVELLLGVFVQDHANDFEKFKALLTKDETSALLFVLCTV